MQNFLVVRTSLQAKSSGRYKLAVYVNSSGMLLPLASSDYYPFELAK